MTTTWTPSTGIPTVFTGASSDEECIHGLVGCAPCQGIDDTEVPYGERAVGHVTPWSQTDTRIARDASLTSREAAMALGRTTNQVSAHRINVLGMKDYAGYVARPR